MNKKEKNNELRKVKKMNFKHKMSKAKEEFLEKLCLPEEVTLGSSKVTLIENKKFYLEANNNIVDYSNEYIKIQTKTLYIILTGKDLYINEISNEDLLVTGKLFNIEYICR